MSIESDALLAVVGIFPQGITPKDFAASQALLTTWEPRLKRWLDGDQKPFKYKAPPKDLEAIFERLAIPMSEGEVTGWLEAMNLDPVLSVDFFMSITEARHYVVEAWPKFTVATQAGPKILPLSVDDAHEVWSLLQVLDDPERILDEMEARTLTPSQAEAFREAYPELYKWVNGSLDMAIADKVSGNPEWAPGWQWEAVLNTLRGMPPEPMPAPPPPPPPPTKGLEIDPLRDATQAEVSSAPKSRSA